MSQHHAVFHVALYWGGSHLSWAPTSNSKPCRIIMTPFSRGGAGCPQATHSPCCLLWYLISPLSLLLKCLHSRGSAPNKYIQDSLILKSLSFDSPPCQISWCILFTKGNEFVDLMPPSVYHLCLTGCGLSYLSVKAFRSQNQIPLLIFDLCSLKTCCSTRAWLFSSWLTPLAWCFSLLLWSVLLSVLWT